MNHYFEVLYLNFTKFKIFLEHCFHSHIFFPLKKESRVEVWIFRVGQVTPIQQLIVVAYDYLYMLDISILQYIFVTCCCGSQETPGTPHCESVAELIANSGWQEEGAVRHSYSCNNCNRLDEENHSPKTVNRQKCELVVYFVLFAIFAL